MEKQQCPDGYALNRLGLGSPYRTAARLRARLGKLALFGGFWHLIDNTND